MPETRKLTGKQQAFIENYCSNGYNGYQAAKSARYKGNYSTLGSIAVENLQKLAIKAAIDDYIKQRQEICEFNREQSERELINAQQRAIASGNITAEIAAIREKNAIFALRTENYADKTIQQPKPLSEQDLVELKKLSMKATGLKIAKEAG